MSTAVTEAAASIKFMAARGWVTQTPRAPSANLLMGPRVHEGRPTSGDERNWIAYWQPDREALRIAAPNMRSRWLTIAQGYARDDSGHPMASLSITMPHGLLTASSVTERTVLHFEGAYYIALKAHDGHSKWFRLGAREDSETSSVLTGVPVPSEARRLDAVAAAADDDDEIEAEHIPNEERETTMANTTKAGATMMDKVKDTVTTETLSAAWRGAAVGAARSARDMLLIGLKKTVKNRVVLTQIQKALHTPYGEAAVGYLLGVALEIKSGPADLKRKRLASELRIGAEAAVAIEVLEPLRQFLTGGIDAIINSLPNLDSLPEPNGLAAGSGEAIRADFRAPSREAVAVPAGRKTGTE